MHNKRTKHCLYSSGFLYSWERCLFSVFVLNEGEDTQETEETDEAVRGVQVKWKLMQGHVLWIEKSPAHSPFEFIACSMMGSTCIYFCSSCHVMCPIWWMSWANKKSLSLTGDMKCLLITCSLWLFFIARAQNGPQNKCLQLIDLLKQNEKYPRLYIYI